MQDKFSSLNLVLKYVRLSYIHIQTAELDHTKPDHSKSDQAGPNESMHHQNVMYRQTRVQSRNKVNRQRFFFYHCLFLKEENISEDASISVLMQRST
jgi:hypothetical protein